MSQLNENAITLVASVTAIALDAAADTEKELYTVPTGKKFIPVMVIAHTFDEAIDEAVVSLGKVPGTCEEFIATQTLTNITASFADQALILQPVPAATPPLGLILDAAEVFGMEITTAETTGTPTCTMDVFGYLYDA